MPRKTIAGLETHIAWFERELRRSNAKVDQLEAELKAWKLFERHVSTMIVGNERLSDSLAHAQSTLENRIKREERLR